MWGKFYQARFENRYLLNICLPESKSTWAIFFFSGLFELLIILSDTRTIWFFLFLYVGSAYGILRRSLTLYPTAQYILTLFHRCTFNYPIFFSRFQFCVDFCVFRVVRGSVLFFPGISVRFFLLFKFRHFNGEVAIVRWFVLGVLAIVIIDFINRGLF